MRRMTEPHLGGPTLAWDSARMRAIAGLSLEFVLDISRISRGEGDLLTPLVLTAILDANQAIVHRDPELARLYGDAGSALPDDLRRPISTNALAKSLRLPFESVRRRVSGWIEIGVCVRTPAGVYVPQAVVTSPAYVAVQAARVARLRRFRADLVQAGFVAAALAEPTPAGMVRAADRALAQYMLRTCDQLMVLARNPVSGFVLLGLAVAGLGSEAQPAGLGLASRQPATVAVVGEVVGMPAETVRRHLMALQRLGFAERTPKGWISAAQPRSWPQLGRLVAQNEANLRRLFDRIGELAIERPACA
jgi:DNA-binding Lrp family transcriptional regulator